MDAITLPPQLMYVVLNCMSVSDVIVIWVQVQNRGVEITSTPKLPRLMCVFPLVTKDATSPILLSVQKFMTSNLGSECQVYVSIIN
jgi:hypothetical protein